MCARKQAILDEWLERVRNDPSIITSRSLDPADVLSCLPLILDNLRASLRGYGCTTAAEQSAENARQFGTARSWQGYGLGELLCEFKHLRSVLIYDMRLFEDQHSDNGMAAMLFISTVVHRFLDAIMIEASAEFMSSHTGSVSLPSPRGRSRRHPVAASG